MDLKFDEKSCGIVLFRRTKEVPEFLLLRYPGGHWDFPKGHVEKGENEYQTARRELLEETGIKKIKIFPGFRHRISYRYNLFGKPSNKQVIFFLAESFEESEVKISHEHRNFLWMPYRKSLKKVTFLNARRLLQKAEKFLLIKKILLSSGHENQNSKTDQRKGNSNSPVLHGTTKKVSVQTKR